MTSARLGLRDLRATLLAVAAATLLVLVRAGVDLPGMHHERLLAGSLFVLGMFACGAGTRPDAFAGHATPFVLGLRLLGAAALVAGIVAVVLSVAVMTDTFVGVFVALWLGTTVRHALTGDTPANDQTAVRTKDLVS